MVNINTPPFDEKQFKLALDISKRAYEKWVNRNPAPSQGIQDDIKEKIDRFRLRNLITMSQN